MKFEIDTGAAVTVIGKREYLNTFNKVNLKPTDLILKSNCGSILELLGCINVQVQYNNIMYALNLYVVNDDKESLLGREWLKIIKLDWPKLFGNSKIEVNKLSAVNEVEKILQKYSSVLEEGVGEIKNITSKTYN